MRKEKTKVSLEDKVTILLLCSIIGAMFMLILYIIYVILCLLQAIL